MNQAESSIRFIKLPSDPEDASDGAVMNALAFTLQLALATSQGAQLP